MAPPPPPPPPPLCFPFTKKKPRRLTDAQSFEDDDSNRSSVQRLQRSGSYSPTATLTSHAEKLTFDTDSESYMVPNLYNQVHEVKPALRRSKTTNTVPETRAIANAGGGSKRWGYGWGVGKKNKEKDREAQMQQRERMVDLAMNSSHEESLPRYHSPSSPEDLQPRAPENAIAPRSTGSLSYTEPTGNNHSRSNTVSSRGTQQTAGSKRSKVSVESGASGGSRATGGSAFTGGTGLTGGSKGTQVSRHTKESIVSGGARRTKESPSPTPVRPSAPRPPLYPSESSSTLIGSAYERKLADVDSYQGPPDTTGRLNALRELMSKNELDYYVIPSEDAHGSEYVAVNDKRREWISGFTGSSGQAIVSKNNAYIVTDSRYWIQAGREVDKNWLVVPAGSHDGPKDWMDWIVDRAHDVRIGIDARMLPHEKAVALNAQLGPKNCKLFYPPQNLVDLIWTDKPAKSRRPIFVQPVSFTGLEAGAKLEKLRAWIREQAPVLPPYSKRSPTDADKHVGTLVSNLACIAWVLNLRGDDIPFNPVFHAYLFVSLESTILFVEQVKIPPEIETYLQSIGVQHREYNDLWSFLRKKEWGEGKVIITPQTSYAISLMLTSYRYTIMPSPIEEWKAIKNKTELSGLKDAYLRDGVAYVRWMAWLEHKVEQGYDITEYEAAWRLTEYRRMGKYYRGLAYENISATGKNAALPHYTPHKSDEVMISRETPYLNDSGGQYCDGTCDTTRTVHFGRPTADQCEAFTRVLQGHIAIDSAIFPEGTSGAQLDVLARRALWKDGLNYMHGTGHGVGAYLNVHEGPHSFTSSTPLEAGHVITNEPGYYKENQFGVRIESALFVKRIVTKKGNTGENWFCFERLTCVPIQTKMVKDNMITKEERDWIKDHNRLCYERLAPFLSDDKRALKWLKREADRGIGMAGSGPGGITIDW